MIIFPMPCQRSLCWTIVVGGWWVHVWCVCICPVCCAEGPCGPGYPVSKPDKGECQRLPCDSQGPWCSAPPTHPDVGPGNVRDLEAHRNTTHRQSAHNLPLANTRGGSCSHKKPPAGLLLWKKAACDLRPSAVGFRLVFILCCCFFKTAAYLSQTGTCRCIAKAPDDGRVGPVENRRCKAHLQRMTGLSDPSKHF